MVYVIIVAVIVLIVLSLSKSKNSSGPQAQAGAGSQPAAAGSENPRTVRDTGSAPKNGNSWGEDMPSEPNQYNYGGTWQEYFSDVLKSGFPQYSIMKNELYGISSAAYRLGRDSLSGTPELLVLVLGENLSNDRISGALANAGIELDEYKRKGIPVARFYHAHPGWWNTRAYVTEAVGKKLGLPASAAGNAVPDHGAASYGAAAFGAAAYGAGTAATASASAAAAGTTAHAASASSAAASGSYGAAASGSYGAAASASYGGDIPAEPNQYNYGGTWQSYFTDVFASEFPAYNVSPRMIYGIDSMVFRFDRGYSSARPELIVLVLAEGISSGRLTEELKRAGFDLNEYKSHSIPVVRFYHDHAGWWNTRSYVVRRTSEALK